MSNKEICKKENLKGDCWCNKSKSIFTNTWVTNNCHLFKSCSILVCKKKGALSLKYQFKVYLHNYIVWIVEIFFIPRQPSRAGTDFKEIYNVFKRIHVYFTLFYLFRTTKRVSNIHKMAKKKLAKYGQSENVIMFTLYLIYPCFFGSFNEKGFGQQIFNQKLS